jgi:transposase InsO family protein
VLVQARGQSDGVTRAWFRFLPALDSYANISTISPAACERIGATIVPIAPEEDQFIDLAAAESRTKRVGRARLRIRCGEVNTSFVFEVLDTPDDIILGLDIFAALGFYIGNVPTQWPGQQRGKEAAAAAAAAEDVLRRRRAPWSLHHRHSAEAIKVLTRLIQQQLKGNADLDTSVAACGELPEGVLGLDMAEDLAGSKTYRRQFQTPLLATEAMVKQVEEWLERGFLEAADPRSDFNSPLIAVSKKDLEGKRTGWRICMDLRHINQLLVHEGFSNGRVPRIEELLARTRGFTHASCLDMSGAYQQLMIREEDRHKLAFTFQGRRLQWKRWPFGLAPATAQFQKIMEIVLDGLDNVICYVDDICVFTKGSMEDHAAAVNAVLQRLNDFHLRLNLQKCHFGFKKILMLGHQLSGDERTIDPLKVQTAEDWAEPRSGKEIMRFLGFTNFLRSSIPDYASIAAPLEALRNQRKLTLDAVQRRAFLELKARISSAPVLKAPLEGVLLQVATDASQSGLGATLYQEVDGVRHYIAFVSKALDGAQRNYPATKRELLGVVFALRAFSHWIMGRHFVLYTDHKSLTTMFTSAKRSYVVDNWLDVLLEYDFDIRHRPGMQMILPDALSRLHNRAANELFDSEEGATQICQEFRASRAVRGMHLSSTVENPAASEQELSEFIAERHGKETIAGKSKQVAHLRATHAVGHFGAEELFRAVWRDGKFWPGMRKQCDDIVGTCDQCLAYKVSRHGFHPTQSLRADNPWDHVAIDCAVDLPLSRRGNSAILIVVDVASRFVVCKALPNTQRYSVARALFEIFTVFGPPKIIQSDRGPEFCNGVMEQLVTAAGMDHRLVAPYNAQANGLAERMVRTVKDRLKKKLAGKLDRWDDALPAAAWAINTKEQALTKTASFTLFFGRGASSWSDYSAMELSFVRDPEIARAQAELQPEEVERLVQQQQEFDSKVRAPVLQASRERQRKNNASLNAKRKSADSRIKAGALVYIIDQNRSSKWTPVNLGPFLVNRKSKRGNTFYLENLSTKGRGGKVYEKPFPAQQLLFVDDTNLPVSSEDGSEVAPLCGQDAVKEVLDERPADGGASTEYKVSWKEKGKEDSWLPEEEFGIGFLAGHNRKTRQFKKRRKLPRKAAKKSAYSF